MRWSAECPLAAGSPAWSPRKRFPLAGAGEERTSHWSRIGCPALIVNGDQDELTDPDELRRRLTLLPQGRLELVAGGGHDLTLQLDRVLDLAGHFLATL
jgi:pimeloyl-ACP methyl ester carboxylesterase